MWWVWVVSGAVEALCHPSGWGRVWLGGWGVIGEESEPVAGWERKPVSDLSQLTAGYLSIALCLLGRFSVSLGDFGRCEVTFGLVVGGVGRWGLRGVVGVIWGVRFPF